MSKKKKSGISVYRFIDLGLLVLQISVLVMSILFILKCLYLPFLLGFTAMYLIFVSRKNLGAHTKHEAYEAKFQNRRHQRAYFRKLKKK